MLSALILNLPFLTNKRGRREPSSTPLALELLSPSSLQLWLEAGEASFALQLFCPGWRTETPLHVQLSAFGQVQELQLEAGCSTREVASALALVLDRWFDITLPTTPTECQRAHLELRPKTRAGLAASSTDGMVLLNNDGRGFDVEIGLDDPTAAGGVITLALEGRVERFATASGQHGAEVMRNLVERLESLGALIRVRDLPSADCYRARVDILAVDVEAVAPAETLAANS